MCEVLGCGFLHLRNLHEELILGSNIVVGSRCSCVAGGVRIKMEEKVSDEVELDVCATMLGLVERGQ